MNINQYPPSSVSMGVLPPPPPPSKFALTAPTYSASCASGATSQAVVPPQTGDSTATSTSSKTISKHDIATDVKGQSSLRPLWRNGEKTFPYKVYDMLEFAETSGNSDICAWLPSGESFVIHDRKLFTEFLLPRFFLHKKWRSFTRQLNIWCFRRDFSVTVSDAYCHPFFKRGEVAKIACVERAETKNMFKKDPVTNKRKLPKMHGASLMSNPDRVSKPHLVMNVSEGSDASTADSTTMKRRVTSPKEEEDVMGVASFLAGLKSSPKTPQKPSVTITASVDEKSAEGRKGKKAMAVTSRINILPHHQSHIALPYLEHEGASTSSIAARPSKLFIPLNAVTNTHNINGNYMMSMNNPTFFGMNGTFDRDSLSHLSTDQLVALASHMKVREQMLRERAMSSLNPVMAPTMAPGARWNDSYQEMLPQHQSAAAAAGMMPSGMGAARTVPTRKPKPDYGDVAEVNALEPATASIPQIAQNSRAA